MGATSKKRRHPKKTLTINQKRFNTMAETSRRKQSIDARSSPPPHAPSSPPGGAEPPPWRVQPRKPTAREKTKSPNWGEVVVVQAASSTEGLCRAAVSGAFNYGHVRLDVAPKKKGACTLTARAPTSTDSRHVIKITRAMSPLHEQNVQQTGRYESSHEPDTASSTEQEKPAIWRRTVRLHTLL